MALCQVEFPTWQPSWEAAGRVRAHNRASSCFLEVNCSAKKINTTGRGARSWKTWGRTPGRFERRLIV